MQEVAWQQYDGLCTVAMVPLQAQVLLYPDMIHIQVRMDTAAVVGFEASGYWTNHTVRSLPEPSVSIQALTDRVTPHAQVLGSATCLLALEDGEVLCHRLYVRHGDDAYLLFFRAADGSQVKLQRLITTASGVYPA